MNALKNEMSRMGNPEQQNFAYPQQMGAPSQPAPYPDAAPQMGAPQMGAPPAYGEVYGQQPTGPPVAGKLTLNKSF